MEEQIKRLYQEANELYKRATAILDEFKGKDMPAEKSNEANTLFDEVEKKTAQAKQLERAVEQKRVLDEANRVPEGNRPGVFNPPAANATPEEKSKQWQAASRKYWMTGDDRELKALSVGSQPSGGYLVADTMVDIVLMQQNSLVAMRGISNVLPPVPAGSVVVPTATPLDDASNNTETGDVVFDSVEPFGDRRLTPHEYDKGILVSTALMRNPRFDVEAWIREQGALACSRKEDYDFITGDGNGKALGLLETPDLPVYTTASSNAVYGDDVINWIYTLRAAYAQSPKARILTTRAFVRKIRTLAKADSSTTFTNYIWQPGLSKGEPPSIDGLQYALSDKMDDGLDTNDAWEDSAIVAVVGDFQYYWIVDALELYVQRLDEAYAKSKQIGFIFTKSTDGMCVLPEAFVGLKIKA